MSGERSVGMRRTLVDDDGGGGGMRPQDDEYYIGSPDGSRPKYPM